MKENKQHCQLPNNMGNTDLTPQDQLIYLSIKRFANMSNYAYPSLQKLHTITGAAINTIKKSIDVLTAKGYITTEKEGKRIKYIFNKYKEFEPFSYEFLDKEDLSFTEKAYLAASQQYMFKDVDGLGKITFSNKDLAKHINMSESTISRCNSALVKKDYLTVIKNSEEHGIGDLKVFQLAKLGQAIIWRLKDHEDRIEENTQNIAALTKTIEEQSRLIEKQGEVLRKVLEELNARDQKNTREFPM